MYFHSNRFLRWSAHNVYLRHSKRVKQLQTRMNRLIHESIDQFSRQMPTIEQILYTMPSKFRSKASSQHIFYVHFSETLEVLVRSSVFYVQEVRKLILVSFVTIIFTYLVTRYDKYRYGNTSTNDSTSFIRLVLGN